MATTLTLFLFWSVGLLGFAARFHGDCSDRLGLYPGGRLSSLGSGLGARRCLLARGGLGGCCWHQGGQGTTFGGGRRRRSVFGLRGAGELKKKKK